MLKKTGIILTLSVTILIACSHFICHLYLNAYKNEFKSFAVSNLNSIGISKITVKKNNLNSKVCDVVIFNNYEEISHNGILYDVLSVENSANEIIYTVVADIEDSRLTNQYLLLFEENETNDNELKKVLKQLLELKYVTPLKTDFSPQTIFNWKNTYVIIISILKPRFLSPETPPPDFS